MSARTTRNIFLCSVLQAMLLAGVIFGLAGCVSRICHDDLVNCKGRCSRAQGCSGSACKQEDLESCRNLAVLYAEGLTAKQNEEAAVELYTLACDRGDALACGYLGFMFENGRGVGNNLVKALDYYKRGCAGNVAVACLGEERLSGK